MLADARKGPAPAPGAGSASLERADTWAVALQQSGVGRCRRTGGRPASSTSTASSYSTSATAVGTEPVVDVVAPALGRGPVDRRSRGLFGPPGAPTDGPLRRGDGAGPRPGTGPGPGGTGTVPRVAALYLRGGPANGRAGRRDGHRLDRDRPWLDAAGTVRSVEPVESSREPGEDRPKVRGELAEFPTRESASGGPVVNYVGELVGILAARESADRTSPSRRPWRTRSACFWSAPGPLRGPGWPPRVGRTRPARVAAGPDDRGDRGASSGPASSPNVPYPAAGTASALASAAGLGRIANAKSASARTRNAATRPEPRRRWR